MHISKEARRALSIAFPKPQPPKLTYQVISADTPDELEEAVNANLDHGWQLQGGICSVPLGDFMQAMTKKEMVQ